MGYYLYVLAMLMVIAWIIGFFGTNAGNFIHILLVIAAIAIFLRITQKPKVA
jgi:hypothetical protein